MQSNLVVTCTSSCTCHHETYLGGVNSFNIICLKNKMHKSSQTRHFRGLNIDCEYHIFSFAPHTFIFPYNICQMVYVPSEGHNYNHVWIFLSSRTKKAFKLASRASHIIICPSDGTYNHLTCFEKKCLNWEYLKKYWSLHGNRKCCLTLRFKGIF